MSLHVEEELPLKQGLKHDLDKIYIHNDEIVEEELPLKQGLKLKPFRHTSDISPG